MHGLIILGSPRKNGNTELLLNKVQQGMEENGVTIEKIRLTDHSFDPCHNCGGCYKTGVCVLEDDMQPFYDKIDHADCLVIGSPIYFYSVTAQTKCFIDRCQALWSRKYNLGIHVADNNKKRCGYFVSVAATKGERVFEGAILTVRYALDAMDFAYCGELLIRGADEKGAVKTMQAPLEQAYTFGLQIGRPEQPSETR